jgi:predicted DNA-binding transcriptional regulator
MKKERNDSRPKILKKAKKRINREVRKIKKAFKSQK